MHICNIFLVSALTNLVQLFWNMLGIFPQPAGITSDCAQWYVTYIYASLIPVLPVLHPACGNKNVGCSFFYGHCVEDLGLRWATHLAWMHLCRMTAFNRELKLFPSSCSSIKPGPTEMEINERGHHQVSLRLVNLKLTFAQPGSRPEDFLSVKDS